MFKRFIPLAISLLASLTAPVMADSNDFSQPIKVNSNRQFVDGKNKTSTFKDDVRITQGSLVIEADEVQVIATGGEGAEVFIARGKPASYSQTMDDGRNVVAKANEIRYEVGKRTISLKGNSEIQQGTSMVKGDAITYDMAKEQLLATGGGEGGSGGRVTTVFRPETMKNGASQNKKPEDQPQEEKK